MVRGASSPDNYPCLCLSDILAGIHHSCEISVWRMQMLQWGNIGNADGSVCVCSIDFKSTLDGLDSSCHDWEFHGLSSKEEIYRGSLLGIYCGKEIATFEFLKGRLRS